jgi:glycosyltransferase involved in cell wall biosynthesis
VALVTNIPAPYRLPVFRRLARDVALTVIYCAKDGQGGLAWELDLDRESFPVIQLDSRVVKRGRVDMYPSPTLIRTLARMKPQAVISGGFSLPTIYASLYCTLLRVPLIVFSDGTAHSERNISSAQKLVRRIIVTRSAAAVAASRPAQRRFVELGYSPSRVHLAPHTTSIARYWDVAKARASAPASDQERFLFVGRLVDGKGVTEMLRAFGEAQLSGLRMRLTIVGSGPLEDGLRKQVAREKIANVDFLGFVDQGEMPQVYVNADSLVFPSFGDTFGMALLEAAAAGLALIASPWAGATEHLVVPEVSGIIVDPADRSALVKAMVRVARDPASRMAWGREAHRLSTGHTVESASVAHVQAVAQALGLGGS